MAVGRKRYRGDSNRQIPGARTCASGTPNNEVHNPTQGLASLTVQELSCAATERLQPTFLVASQRAREFELFQSSASITSYPQRPSKRRYILQNLDNQARLPASNYSPSFFRRAFSASTRLISVRASALSTTTRIHHYTHHQDGIFDAKGAGAPKAPPREEPARHREQGRPCGAPAGGRQEQGARRGPARYEFATIFCRFSPLSFPDAQIHFRGIILELVDGALAPIMLRHHSALLVESCVACNGRMISIGRMHLVLSHVLSADFCANRRETSLPPARPNRQVVRECLPATTARVTSSAPLKLAYYGLHHAENEAKTFA